VLNDGATFVNITISYDASVNSAPAAFSSDVAAVVAYFESQYTDAISFNNVGIPASGVLTGQDCCKTQAEVDLFGGTTGPFEGIGVSPAGCVDNPFLWCDNLFNNDFDVMTFMSRGFANMVLTMAFDTKVMSASNSVVYKKRLPIAAEHSLHSSTQ